MTTTTARPRSSADWIAIEQATYFANRRPPMVIERGEGCRVWDVEGNEYLDMIAGIAVVSLGHSSPVVQRALAQQAATLIHISNLYYSIPQLQLAELLTKLALRSGLLLQQWRGSQRSGDQARSQVGQAQSQRRVWHYHRGSRLPRAHARDGHGDW